MSEPNILSLDIIANDLSSSGFASAKANASSYFSSVETEARRAAASLDALERRAALAGTGGQERLNLQRSFSLSDLRLAQDQVVNLTEAWDRLSSAEKHAVDIASLADITPRAAEGATTREEQIRRDLLAFDQFRAAQRQANIESSQRDVSALQRGTKPFLQTPGEVVAAERSRFFQNFTGTDAQRAEAEAAFAVRANRATLEEIALKAEASRVGRQKGEADFASALKSQQGLDSYIKSLEKEAALYGLKGAALKRAELAQLLAQYKGHPAVIDALTASYGKMIKAAEAADSQIGGHGGGAKAAFLGLKDLGEGNTRYAGIEGVNFLRSLTGVPLLAGGAAAAVLGLGAAAVVSLKHLADFGVEIEDIHLKTGLAVNEVLAFKFAAEATGTNVSVYDRLVRGLAQAYDENAAAGKRGRSELHLLGVDLYDQTGKLKPVSQQLLELADAFNKIPPGLEKEAAILEIAKRGGAEAIPALEHLREYTEFAKQHGLVVTEAEIKIDEGYKRDIAIAGELWDQLKRKIEARLATTLTVTLQFLKPAGDLLSGNADALTKALNAKDFHAATFGEAPPREAPAGTGDITGEYVAAVKARQALNKEIESYQSTESGRPDVQLKQAQARVKAAGELTDHSTRAQFEEYKAAQQNLLNVEGAQRERSETLKNIVRIREEGQKYDAQISEQESAGEERRLEAAIDAKKEYATSAEILALYQQSDQNVIAAENARIQARRYVVDPKTGREIDRSGTAGFAAEVAAENANLPQAEAAGYARINAKISQFDERKAKADEASFFSPIEKQYSQRTKIEQELFTNSEKMDREYGERKFTIEAQAAEREKTLALDQLGLIDAQTIQQKLALEDQKLAIELRYSERSLDIQTRKLESERRREIDTRTGELNRAGIPSDSDARVEAIRQINEKYDLQEQDIRTATVDKEVDAAQKVANEKTKLGIQQNERIFDSLKRSAEGVFDALLTKSKSFSDVMKDLFKTAILTPIKDILSSQTAALFTELLTGQKVTFAPLGNGQGPLGELGNVLGRLGLGQRIIGNQAPHGVNLPNHLGDVTLISGAVPVFAVNLAAGTSIGARAITPGILQAHALSTPFRGIPSLADGGLDLANLLPQTPYEKVDSSVSYPSIYDTSSRSGPRSPQDPSLLSAHGFVTLGQQLASASSDLSGIFAGGSNAYSDQYVPISTTLGAFKAINDLVTNIPEAPPYTVATSGLLSRILGGGGGGSAAGVGGLLSSIGLGPGGTSGFAGPVGGHRGNGGIGGSVIGDILQSVRGGGIDSSTLTGLPGGQGDYGGEAEAASEGRGIFSTITHSIGGIFNSGNPNNEGSKDGSGEGTDNQPPGANLIGAIGFALALDGLRRKVGTASAIETSLGGAGIGYKLGGVQGGFIGAGIGLAADGTRRGGVGGILEASGGGALAGGAIGGPIGAVVGAGIGAGVATIRTLFFESDRAHTKKLVKQIYGFDINDSTADAIIQIAKQKYGGAISIAVRSQEVRELLKLYAETIGNKGAKDQFVADTVHSASLVESRGQLYQNAIYDNGEAYSYAGPLGVLGGISTTKLPTAARDSGGFYGNLSINLNGQSALGALAGQVVRVSTPSFIQSQSVSGSRASIGRNSQAALNFAPSAISR